MTYPISELNGITLDQIKLLKSLGIRTTEKLLEAACTPRRRKVLATKTSVPADRWLSWANNADRMRIKGIGQDNARLLQEVGVKTARDLRYRNPRKLAEALRARNGELKLVRLPPTENAIKRWIAAAGKLDRRITY